MLKIFKDKYLIFSVLLFMYFIAISNFKNFFLSLIAILFCLIFINRPQYLLPHVIITSLFGDYFVALPGIGMSRIVGIFFVLSVCIRKYKSGSIICINRKLFISISILSLLSLISCMNSITGNMISAYVLILNFMIMASISMLSYEELIEGLFSLRINTIIMILNILFSILFGKATFYAERLTFHETLNSNGLGMAVVQLAIFLLAIMYFKNIQQNKKINIILVLCCIFIILLTGSRTSLIAVLGTISFLFIYYGLFNEEKIIKIQYILIPIILFFAVLFIINNVKIEMFNRFTADSVMETGGSGRSEIWQSALENVYPKYPIFGVGIGVENTVAALSPYGLPNNVGIHNMYITLLIQTGIVGTIIFLFVILKHTFYSLKSIKVNSNMFLPALMLVAALINGIGEEVYAERFIWVAIGMIYVLLKKRGEGYFV